MPRKKTKSLKRDISPDSVYGSVLVSRLINKVMKSGKRRTAERLVYRSLEQLALKTKLDPIEAFETSIKNISPQLEVKSKRVGGATYQVPIEVRGDRKIHLAFTWLLQASRAKSGKSFDKLLAAELIDAFNNAGDAVKKKNDTHQMAEANRAFAHFARF